MNVVCVVLAVLVPFAVLWTATPTDERAAGLIASPFGRPPILAAHLLTALPLSFLLAGVLHRSTRAGHRAVEIAMCLALTVAIAWASRTWGHEIARSLGRGEDTFAIRVAMRTAWCVLLQTPWLLLGCCLSGCPESVLRLPGWLTVLLAVVVAVGLPAVYTQALLEAQRQHVAELMARGRWLRAQQQSAGLDDWTPPASLNRTVTELTAVVARPLPTNATPKGILSRAQQLAALDRLDEAQQLVRPLADVDPDAGLLLAAIAQDRQQWTESTNRYRAVLDQLATLPTTDAVKLQRVEAYDGLSFNAREQRDFATAIAVYREALANVEGAEAYYHFQLGRQLQQAGRPDAALEHLETAIRLQPQGYAEQAEPLIQDIRTHTLGCFLRPSR